MYNVSKKTKLIFDSIEIDNYQILKSKNLN